MKLLLIRLLSSGWTKVSAAFVYRPVIRTYAVLAYLSLAASLALDFAGPQIVTLLLTWCPDINRNTVGIVLDAAGFEVGLTSLLLGLAGCVMCHAYRTKYGEPSRFVLSASYAAWISLVLLFFAPATHSA